MPESQYSDYPSYPREMLGLRANVWYQTDPRGLLFHLARYKHVGKMLHGKAQVLEVGCGDCFGTRLVQQEVGHVTAIDFDIVFIGDAIQRQAQSGRWVMDKICHDMLKSPVTNWAGALFDAAFALDVIEHIQPRDEKKFMDNIAASLLPNGVLILGTPSKESQAYASEGSRAGHVNLKDAAQLAALMGEYFENTFSFSMNDETLHTGYSAMAHYLLCIGAGKR